MFSAYFVNINAKSSCSNVIDMDCLSFSLPVSELQIVFRYHGPNDP